MAISDDLNSIRTHLEDDYEALEQLGVSVEDRNIENIKDMAQQIYAKFPKTEFQEGTDVTIEGGLKGKLDFDTQDGKKVVGYGDTEQDGEPTPSTPVSIQCVTGNQSIVESGKNLFEPVLQIDDTDINLTRCTAEVINGVMKFTATAVDWYFGDVTNAGSTWTAVKGLLMEVKEGETYNIVLSNTNIVKNYITYYDKDKKSLGNEYKSTNSFSFTASTGVKYISLRIGLGNATIVGTTYETTILVAKGNDTTYEPYHTPITYPISLGNIELCKIGDYADELLYDVENDKVYKNKNIGKAVLKSDMNWSRGGTAVSGKARYYTTYFTSIIKKPSSVSVVGDIMCNYYKAQVSASAGSYGGNQGIAIADTGTVYINDDNYADNLSGWTTWLDSVSCFFYYALDKEVKEEITGTLKDQIKALYNSQSFTGTTILESNGDLPMIIKVRALKGE